MHIIAGNVLFPANSLMLVNLKEAKNENESKTTSSARD